MMATSGNAGWGRGSWSRRSSFAGSRDTSRYQPSSRNWKRWRRLSRGLSNRERRRRVGYTGVATFHGGPGVSPVLPENKVSLYRTFVDLYCGGWDAAKGIAKSSRFKSEQKLRLLTALAYRMHMAHKPECTEERFVQALKETMPALEAVSQDFLTEIIQDGILVR